jgi:hypothetical protein
MKRKHENINGHNISVWDDPKFIDRFTVVFLDETFKHPAHNNVEYVNYLVMNETPFHPQGFCQHGEMPLSAVAYKGRGGCFIKRIKFDDLPEDCKKAVYQDFEL